MEVDFNKTFKNYKGEDATEKEQTITIKDAVCQRLYLSGEGITPDEKYEAYKLMLRIVPSDGAVEIKDKESVLIKKICDKTLTAGAYGQLVDLLNESK